MILCAHYIAVILSPTFTCLQNPVLSSALKKLPQSILRLLLVHNFYCCFSAAKSCPTLWQPNWLAACQPSLSFTISQSFLKLMSIESAMPSNHLILCHPLFLLPSIFPRIRVFSNESALHIRWAKYWSFSFSISPSNVYPGLISFRIDWVDALVNFSLSLLAFWTYEHCTPFVYHT